MKNNLILIPFVIALLLQLLITCESFSKAKRVHHRLRNDGLFLKVDHPPSGIVALNYNVKQDTKKGDVKPAHELKSQIIRGVNISRTDMPWQAFLITNKSITCGGTLISKTCVLTAGHCVYKAKMVEVYMGGVERFKFEAYEQYFRAKKYIWHEKFNVSNLAYDIGMVFFEKEARIDPYTKTLRLPKTSDATLSFARTPCVACGYGLMENNGTYSSNLKCVNLTVTSNSACMRHFKYSLIRSYSICTVGLNGGSICKGDSGGPLMYRESDGKLTLIGITSFVALAGCSGYPNGFMRVTSFLDWILKNSNVTRLANGTTIMSSMSTTSTTAIPKLG